MKAKRFIEIRKRNVNCILTDPMQPARWNVKTFDDGLIWINDSDLMELLERGSVLVPEEREIK